jgi:hypothetical protein
MHAQTTSHSQYTQTMYTYTYNTVESINDVATAIQSAIPSRSTQLALVTISLRFEHDGKLPPHLQAQADQSTRYLLDNLRPLVRKTDVVLLTDHTFYFLLLGANLDGGGIVQARLWEALLWRVHNAPEGDFLHPHSMMIGHSAYPLPYEQVQECIEIAGEPSQSISFYPDKIARKSATRSGKRSRQTIKEHDSHDFPDIRLLAKKAGIPYLSLLPRKLPLKLQQLISPQLALELGCFPLGRERDTLTVAIANPQDRQILDRLQKETGLHIFPVLAPPQELQTALEQLV